jgi:RNA polymerase sigma-70 factor (ECF subfamily)
MEDWEEHRRYLFALAYRLLGSAVEAEDAVQEAFVRLRTSAPTDLRNPRGWLTTVTSRICLDVLRSARVRRESYVGTWLPEPLAGYDDTDLGEATVLRESVRTAVLLVLERLTPAERVAFVLHDVFGMDFDRLADVVGRTPGACRQLASRARRRLRAEAPPRTPVPPGEHRQVATAFLDASASGDVAALVALLDPDVVLRSDGGGQVPAARTPVHGRDRVLQLLAGLSRRYPEADAQPVRLASGDGLLLRLAGIVIGVIGIETAGDRITELNLVVNPAKLHRVQALAR